MSNYLKIFVFLFILCFGLPVRATQQTLNIYAWGGYLPQEALDTFAKQEGVTINYSTFDNNESMYTKMKMVQGKGYDVVFASAYFIHKMAAEGLLARLDHAQLSNMSQAMPALMGLAHDPHNDYSLPYIWGVTGMSYNASQVDGKISKWSDLWNKKYVGQVMLTDDIRDVFGMALKMNGHSINSTNPAEIKQAYESLQALLPNIQVYNSDAPQMPYLSGDVIVGMQWNGNAYQGQSEMPELTFVMPEEGAVLWMDNFTISSASTNKALAHKFINFMYQPKNQALIVETLGYASATNAGRELLPAELRDNKTIYPAKADMDKGEFINDVGPDALKIYEKYWEQLRNQ